MVQRFWREVVSIPVDTIARYWIGWIKKMSALSLQSRPDVTSERSKRARDLRNRVRGKAAYQSDDSSSSSDGSDSESDDDKEDDDETSNTKSDGKATKESRDPETTEQPQDGPLEIELDDAGLLKLGIEPFTSKKGNQFFRCTAAPSKGPFQSIVECLAFMKGKYYRNIQSTTAKLMNGPVSQESLDNKTAKKALKSKRNKEKLTLKRKKRHDNLTEKQIAAKKAKFQRKKQRRLERKAQGITTSQHGSGKSTTFELE